MRGCTAAYDDTSPTTRWIRNGSWLLFLFGGWLGIIWFWEWSYLTLTVDDSFYYLQTARNLAQGYGSTFDRLNPTNGYHPLWLLVLTLLQPILPQSTATMTRIVLTLQLALVGLALLGLFRMRILHGLRSSLGLVLLFSCFYTTKILVNALESALLFVGMVALLCCWFRLEKTPPSVRKCRPWTGTLAGIIAGLVVLARLESMAFVLLVLSMPWIWPIAPAVAPKQDKIPWLWAWSVCLIMVASYLLWNWGMYGHLLPISGAVKFSQRPWLSLGSRIAWIPVLLVSLVAPWIWAKYTVPNHRIYALLRFIFPVWGYAVAVFGYQILVLGHLLPPLWYTVPHLLVAIVVLEILYNLAESSPWVVRILWSLGIAWIGILAITWWYRIHPDSYRLYVERRNVGVWLRKYHPNDIIAGWDCGIAAAHFQGKWINLDGLINSWNYKTQYLDRNRTQEFIDRKYPVDRLVQHIPLHIVPTLRQWRGVDLSAWSVKQATCVRGRVMRRPKTPMIWVQLVLSRTNTGLPWPRFAKQAQSLCVDAQR